MKLEVKSVHHPLYRILIALALLRASRAKYAVSIVSMRPNSIFRTFEFLSFLALLVIEHKTLQLLLFNFVLQLSTTCVNG